MQTDELWEAVRLAFCENVVIEKGLHTIVGGKNGIRLSGGERR